MKRTKLVTKSGLAIALATGLAVGLSAPCRADDTAKVYADNCASCHGPQGKGDGPAAAALTPPPGSFAQSIAGKSDDWIFKGIKEGGPGVGKALSMPPYAGTLSDDQIKAMVAYVKQLQK